MARVRTPNQKKAYNALNTRLTQYVGQVQSIYDIVNQKVADLALGSSYDGSSEFFFRDYPELAEAVKDIQAQFTGEMKSLIMRCTSAEWKQSNLVQDLLADKVLKHYRAQVRGKRFKQYYQTNSEALQAFQKRRDRGMNLSAKLWGQSEEYIKETEAAISVTISNAITKGMSAITLSKRLSKYLADYPTLQQDYWETYGKAANIHDCEYRSIRLARSEINMAYRTAEQERWKQFDFITGYEIKLSGSHPKEDICDILKGKYPKDFKWTGWHPNDMCYVVPIIMDEDSYWKMREEETPPIDMITEMPQNYKDWVTSNLGRIRGWDSNNTLPYFLKDNPDFRTYLGTDYVTEYRHRTRDANAIQRAWNNRRAMLNSGDYYNMNILRMDAHYIGFDMSELEDLIRTKDLEYDRYNRSKIFTEAYTKTKNEYKEAYKQIKESYTRLTDLRFNIRLSVGPFRSQQALDEIENAVSGFSLYGSNMTGRYSAKQFEKVYKSANKKYRENLRRAKLRNEQDVENVLGIKKGHPMSYKDADDGRGNIYYNTGEEGYRNNCQCCVIADELRRRGYNVTAIKRGEDSIVESIAEDKTLAYIDKKNGRNPLMQYVNAEGRTDEDVFKLLDKATKAKGRYTLGVKWAERDWGHVVRIERRANGMLRYYDPQNGKEFDIMYLISIMDKHVKMGILKTDELLFNPDVISHIVKPLQK